MVKKLSERLEKYLKGCSGQGIPLDSLPQLKIEINELETRVESVREPLKVLMKTINLMSTGSAGFPILFFYNHGDTITLRQVQELLLEVHSKMEFALGDAVETRAKE